MIFISLTAASLFVWQEELTNWVHHDLVFIEKSRNDLLPLDKLFEKAQQAVPGHPISRVTVNRDERKAYVFSNFKQGNKNGIWYNNNVISNDLVYVNPYEGKAQGVVDNRYDWIWCLYPVHVCLFFGL